MFELPPSAWLCIKNNKICPSLPLATSPFWLYYTCAQYFSKKSVTLHAKLQVNTQITQRFLILRLMARGIGLIQVYRIFMTGHRFDSRTRDFDITIFTSGRVWEIEGIRILATLSAWFFGFGFVAVCGFSPLSAFFFFFGSSVKRKKFKRSFVAGIQ